MTNPDPYEWVHVAASTSLLRVPDGVLVKNVHNSVPVMVFMAMPRQKREEWIAWLKKDKAADAPPR